ncbi:MAG TPA: colanic acid biosynthesis glycosyl transferase [Cellvibrio sp.]|uniref:glycosyltransferase n=1 Tax=Cellvibrio sp. TaxID=1965322 RepID=UPI000EEDDB7A|nr:glycosyltransferase [Cellvibrio sp.]HCS62602.1 colanic acid biosynthesis glycosyl transferase [Cellvibrio sp.]
MSKKVIVYQDGLLSYSETFIKQQTLALKSWRPILIGHKYLNRSLDFSMIESQLLLPEGSSIPRRLLYMVYRWLNKADPAGINTLKDINADLVHAHFGTSAIDIWPYAKALNLPMLVTLHGFDISIYKEWWESGKRGRRKRKYPQQLLQLALEPNVHFLAVSSAIKERAIQFGIPADKITVSYIGVNSEDFTPGSIPILERKNRILYVGRLVEKKGAKYLIEAFAKVKKTIPDAELVIVGKGGMEEQLLSQVKQLNLADVTFTGALTSAQVKEQIDNCKIFCLPSITANSGDAEGLPISILEAQASGVFVVSSSSGGVGDNLIDRETCFTFAEKDSNALTSILTDILDTPENYLGIINNQQELIKSKFQIRNCALELEKLYAIYSKP